MPNPYNAAYCKIVGNFQVLVADSGDVDELPDFQPVSGFGVITPEITEVFNTEEGHKSHIYMEPISVLVDSDGDLSQGDHKYVMLLVPEHPIVPEDFKYSITLYLSAPETTMVPVTFGPVSFSVVANGTVNLADL